MVIITNCANLQIAQITNCANFAQFPHILSYQSSAFDQVKDWLVVHLYIYLGPSSIAQAKATSGAKLAMSESSDKVY